MYSPGAISNIQKTSGQYIMLTFDDGPHGTLTPKLLDILKEKNAKATFFVMGIKAILHPNILKRMVAEGHEVANHAWNHPIISKVSQEVLHSQLERTSVAIKAATDVTPALMRPPYGNTNKKVNEYITTEENMKVIMWSLDTRDWKRPKSEEIKKHAVNTAKPGSLIYNRNYIPAYPHAHPQPIILCNSRCQATSSSVMISTQEQ